MIHESDWFSLSTQFTIRAIDGRDYHGRRDPAGQQLVRGGRYLDGTAGVADAFASTVVRGADVGDITAAIIRRVEHRNDGSIQRRVTANVHNAADNRAGENVFISGFKGGGTSNVHVEIRSQDGGLLKLRLVVECRRSGEIQVVAHPPRAAGRAGGGNVGHDGPVERAVFESNVIGRGRAVGIGRRGLDEQNVLKRAVFKQGMGPLGNLDVAECLVLIHFAKQLFARTGFGHGVSAGRVREIFRHGRRGGRNCRTQRLIGTGIIVRSAHAGHRGIGDSIADSFVRALDFVLGAIDSIALRIEHGLIIFVQGFHLEVIISQVVQGNGGADGSFNNRIGGRFNTRSQRRFVPRAIDGPVNDGVLRNPHTAAAGNGVVQDIGLFADFHFEMNSSANRSFRTVAVQQNARGIGVVSIESKCEALSRTAKIDGLRGDLLPVAPGIREGGGGTDRQSAERGVLQSGAEIAPNEVGFRRGNRVPVGAERGRVGDDVFGAFQAGQSAVHRGIGPTMIVGDLRIGGAGGHQANRQRGKDRHEDQREDQRDTAPCGDDSDYFAFHGFSPPRVNVSNKTYKIYPPYANRKRTQFLPRIKRPGRKINPGR